MLQLHDIRTKLWESFEKCVLNLLLLACLPIDRIWNKNNTCMRVHAECTHLSGMYYMWRCQWPTITARLFVRSAIGAASIASTATIDRVLQCAALRMCLWIVHLEAYLLEQRPDYRTTARSHILLYIRESLWPIAHHLLWCMRMAMAMAVPVAVTMITATAHAAAAATTTHAAYVAATAHIHLLTILYTHFHFLCHFLYRSKSLLAHLYALGHVADRRVLCSQMCAPQQLCTEARSMCLCVCVWERKKAFRLYQYSTKDGLLFQNTKTKWWWLFNLCWIWIWNAKVPKILFCLLTIFYDLWDQKFTNSNTKFGNNKTAKIIYSNYVHRLSK